MKLTEKLISGRTLSPIAAIIIEITERTTWQPPKNVQWSLAAGIAQ